MLPDQSQCPCLSTRPKICTFRHFSMCVCLIARHSPQPSSRSGTGSAWLHTRTVVHSSVCLSVHMHVCMHENTDSPVCSLLLKHFMVNPDDPHLQTHTYCYHSDTDNSRRGDCWELYVCWLKCWAMMPWQPSLNLLSTSSPLLLCCDSHHNGCWLWTCQAAKDTKTTQSTFDIRSCHQKTKDKLSWQLC